MRLWRYNEVDDLSDINELDEKYRNNYKSVRIDAFLLNRTEE